MDIRLKLTLAVVILFMAGIPVAGILKGTQPPPSDPDLAKLAEPLRPNELYTSSDSSQTPIKDEMVFIPAGEFIQGTKQGGFNERPERIVSLPGFWINRHEITNHQYFEFVEQTGHRFPGPPARYAKGLSQIRGTNQPVAYVSWADAKAFCEWKGRRLPFEAEWEKSMRGIDGRLWPWGNSPRNFKANLGGIEDGFKATAPVGSFPLDRSPFGIYDGFGNLMEWVNNWYEEQAPDPNDPGEDHHADRGGYKTLRGSGYTSYGIDLRLTARNFMVPNFRDETIGFRCATSKIGGNPNDE